MDVLITGAHGTVGTAITDHLGDDDRYNFTLLDVDDAPSPHETAVADVRAYDEIRPHFEGQDAVVHLALIPGTGGPDSRALGWNEPQADNLEGIHNVTEAAVDAGLDSIVFASSNHAVGMVEGRNAPDVYHDRGIVAGHDEPHRPDSRYGLTKSYGEDLGRRGRGTRDQLLRSPSRRDPGSGVRPPVRRRRTRCRRGPLGAGQRRLRGTGRTHERALAVPPRSGPHGRVLSRRRVGRVGPLLRRQWQRAPLARRPRTRPGDDRLRAPGRRRAVGRPAGVSVTAVL
ncbi:NAD-dependent epimerase/dehydratase family protein [Halomicroarcula sp. GCM10025709]|uniref:NAD-dependent epimerase/dehydratase family protein n=1 Tax=Halomicroarcula sp. GCM10025709 TaxID=3252669 RepID=UPI003621610D